jgi:2-polyprenyl-3-methyl-5-hydroxy-6-metoxy-1,4-benzoquinol methylase
MQESYYTHARPEIRALVPLSAQRVVDVGCGEGLVGAALKAERPGLQVRGIEITEAAELAKTRLDAAVQGTAEATPPPDWPAPDCVIFADVLEHLVDPWDALRVWGDRLEPGGTAVISLPNVAHWSVVSSLILGRFAYEQEGIMDRTHLRFFTRDTAVQLIEKAGFVVDQKERVVALAPGALGALGKAAIRRERAGKTLHPVAARLADLCSYQFLFRAHRPR